MEPCEFVCGLARPEMTETRVRETMRPYMDQIMPEVWKSAQQLSLVIRDAAASGGLSAQEAELIKVRASQINGCNFCLDLHAREARATGVVQQKLDVLPAWRESSLYTERERAVIAIAEAATKVPTTENSQADLIGAQHLLGEATFVAAEWVAVAINMFNRISILSEHPVRPRDADGKVVK